MNETLVALRSILSTEVAIYAELNSLAEQQREALIYRRTDALPEIAVAQTKLIARALRLEKQARETLAAAGAASVAEAAAGAGDDTAGPLLELRERLAAAADQLSRVNHVNAELFEGAMDAIRFTIQLLAGTARAPEPCYAVADAARSRSAFLLDQHA